MKSVKIQKIYLPVRTLNKSLNSPQQFKESPLIPASHNFSLRV